MYHRYEEGGALVRGAVLMNVGIRINDLYRKKHEGGHTVQCIAVKNV